jgi:hypothetical protein
MRLTTRTAALAAALATMATPALAYGPDDNPGSSFRPDGTPNGTDNPGAGHRPDGTPPSPGGTTNPGAEHRPTRAQARAIGREECQEFKRNFRENRSAFGRCVAAVARSVRSDATPARACREQRLSRERHDGQARSDFRACVLAAARAQRDRDEAAADQPAA